jgi:hypothetical protein
LCQLDPAIGQARYLVNALDQCFKRRGKLNRPKHETESRL